MKSVTSLFNRGFIISDIKRFWWISAIHAIVLFFILPFTHMTQDLTYYNQWVQNRLRRSLTFDMYSNGMQLFLLYVVPVLLAVLLFRYMQVIKSTGTAHSLPCKRRVHYCSHSLVGIIMYSVPVVLNGIVLMIIQRTTVLNQYYTLRHIWEWMGITILFGLLFFAVSVFVGMFTGNSVAQIAFTYIFHILPGGIYALINYNLSYLVRGYTFEHFSESVLTNFPIIRVMEMHHTSLTTMQVIIYLIMTVFFLVGAVYVYEKRNAEDAGDVIAFRFMRPVFTYGVVVCSMLLSAVYFTSLANGAFWIIVFGYVITSFLGYWIAQILLHKSFRVWHLYKGYLAYVFLIILILAGISADVTGYVKRVPNPEQVESIYFGYSLGEWRYMQKSQDYIYRHPKYSSMHFFWESENIEHVTQLHKSLTKQPRRYQGRKKYIIYTLENGKNIIREYFIDEQLHAPYIAPIYESFEYKAARFPVLRQKVEEVKTIELNDTRTPKRPIIISDIGELKEIISLMKYEILDLTYDKLTQREVVSQKERAYGSIRITDMEGETYHYTFRESYSRILNWLKENQHYQEVMLMPEEIEYALIYQIGSQLAGNIVQTQQKEVEIRDLALIAEIVKVYEPIDYSKRHEAINIRFYIKDGGQYHLFEGQIYEHTPILQELKAYLEQMK